MAIWIIASLRNCELFSSEPPSILMEKLVDKTKNVSLIDYLEIAKHMGLQKRNTFNLLGMITQKATC